MNDFPKRIYAHRTYSVRPGLWDSYPNGSDLVEKEYIRKDVVQKIINDAYDYGPFDDEPPAPDLEDYLEERKNIYDQ